MTSSQEIRKGETLDCHGHKVCIHQTIILTVVEVGLQLSNSLQDRFFVSRTDRIFSIVDVAERLTEQSRFERTDTANRILVQERISTNGHFDFSTLHQVDGWIQLFELVQAEKKKKKIQK